MWLRLFATAALVAFSASQALAKDVPNVLGLKLTDATKVITDAGYKAIESKNGKISTFPIDTVGVQIPSGGTELKPGSDVTLFPSSGVCVRNFAGSTIDKVEMEMQKTGLKFEKKDDDVPGKLEGIVTNQDPAPDKWVDASNTVVVLYVTTGKVKVPNLIGLSMSNSTSQATPLGLKIKVVSGIDADGSYPPGPNSQKPGYCVATTYIAEVIKQAPAANTAVSQGSSLEVSTTRKDISVHQGPCVCSKEDPFECRFL